MLTASDPVRRAIADIAAGRPVVVVDDETRQNEGDLVFAAQRATPGLMSFLVRHTSGFVCVALTGEDCARLNLPPMCHFGAAPFGTAYTVTVDAAEGVSTGISARDRARTARLLASPESAPADLTRPGHVVGLRAHDGGVLCRPGHTEAAVDLARLAGLRPASVLGALVSTRSPAGMAGRDELAAFAGEHDLRLVSIAELVDYRRAAVESGQSAPHRVEDRTALPRTSAGTSKPGTNGREPVREIVLER